jgi:hypothetical protein
MASERSENGGDEQRSGDGDEQQERSQNGSEQQRSEDGEGKGRDSEDREGKKRRSSSEESSGREGSFAAGFGQTLPMALVGVIIVLYFVWICYELGSHAHDGLGIVFGVFGAILVGILSAAVAMGMRKIASRSNSND